MFQEVAENGADTAHLSAVHGPPVFSKIVHSLSCIARHSWKNDGWAPHKSFTDDKSSDNDDSKKETEDRSKLQGIHDAETHISSIRKVRITATECARSANRTWIR